jgi:hypothetical protein
MSSLSARIYATLFYTSAVFGHTLWREQLALHETPRGRQLRSGLQDSCMGLRMASYLRNP